MKTIITVLIAVIVGVGTGFFVALFIQALGQMSAEEEARREYVNLDPWDVMPDEYDKFTDDKLTN